METKIENMKTGIELNTMERVTYITGRKCETFFELESAKQYADKWRSTNISVYKNRTYFSTIHKINGIWNE